MKNLSHQLFTLLLLLGTIGDLAAQNDKTEKKDTPTIVRRQTTALRVPKAMKIDGILDEADWQNAAPTDNFILLEPTPGKEAMLKTDVRILYTDEAVYIGAMMYDPRPDSIAKELTARDGFGNSDWFGVVFDTYKDGNNGSGFFVQASGVQGDAKYSLNDGEDFNWNAVWNSKVRFNEKGWVAELEIPFAAIRFPTAKEQNWRINFGRNVRRNQEKSFWNNINPTINGFLTQFGEISGISNIKSPVRLQATPFVSAYSENLYNKNSNPKSNWLNSFNGGMDIKYGLNDAFTLDMTLIPDFGQVRSDNKVLNLTPFEVRFDEQRAFFTEGTELFNKAGLFYSRRVGGDLIRQFDVYGDLKSNETVTNNPSSSRLYNATKVSGRTNTGLGIGVFNATSAATYATILDTVSGTTREYLTNPLTNFNVVVFDQNLKNNSSVTFTNTNVMRDGSERDANVTAAQFSINNKANKYQIRGAGYLNQIYSPSTVEGSTTTALGHKARLGFSKTSGNFTFDVDYNIESDRYNPNDLGYLQSPNEKTLLASANYGIYKPFGKFNRANFNMYSSYGKLYKPDAFAAFNIGSEIFFLTKERIGFGAYANLEPVNNHDYFEPRTRDFSMFVLKPKIYEMGAFFSSDYRKKLALDINATYVPSSQAGRYAYFTNISPRYRVNDKLSINLNASIGKFYDNVGYVRKNTASQGYAALPSGAILMGTRNRNQFENVLNVKYSFNSLATLTFRLRHYWATAQYSKFSVLQKNGTWLDEPQYTGTDSNGNRLHDNNYNAFNIDMVYTWRFAPGSDLILVWKNAIYGDESLARTEYSKNFDLLGNYPQSNSFSMKVIYFLDYLSVKKLLKKGK